MIDRPRVRRSPIDGAILTRGVRPFTVAYKGVERVVDLPGWYPIGKGEGIHDSDDLAVTDAALADIKAELDRQHLEALVPAPGPKRDDRLRKALG